MICRSLLVPALACAALLAGCAAGGVVSETGPGVMRAGGMAPQAAGQAVAGKHKADVAAILGPATVVRFDSGYEVWVYRWPGPDRTIRTATELVVLLDPSGLVKKARVRPGYPPERK